MTQLLMKSPEAVKFHSRFLPSNAKPDDRDVNDPYELPDNGDQPFDLPMEDD